MRIEPKGFIRTIVCVLHITFVYIGVFFMCLHMGIVWMWRKIRGDE